MPTEANRLCVIVRESVVLLAGASTRLRSLPGPSRSIAGLSRSEGIEASPSCEENPLSLRTRYASSFSVSCATGRETLKVEPTPTWLFSSIVPAKEETRSRVIARPRPIPNATVFFASSVR